MDISEIISPIPLQSQEGMFTCNWTSCGKSFGRRSDLERHYRIHINDRPFACSYKDCRKRFIQRSALTVHMRTHTGERPHVCEHPDCNKSFSDSSSLARHRRIHTGKRPYICQYKTCGKSFTKKILLARHCRVEHAATMSRVRRTSSNGSEQDTYYDVTNSSSPSLASPKQPSPPYDYDSHCDMSCKGASEWTSFYHYVNPPATDIIDGIRSIPYFSPTNPIYINAPPMGPISRTAMTCFVEEKKKNNKKAITRNTPSQEE